VLSGLKRIPAMKADNTQIILITISKVGDCKFDITDHPVYVVLRIHAGPRPTRTGRRKSLRILGFLNIWKKDMKGIEIQFDRLFGTATRE
jgi:hypothetical protein